MAKPILTRVKADHVERRPATTGEGMACAHPELTAIIL